MVELIFKPFVPDNITNSRVFNDDSHILDFLTNADTFKDVFINDEKHGHEIQQCKNEENDVGTDFVPKNVLDSDL
jgi:hypothetical protein